jgi:uncharacterized protein (TIGR00369 family)
MKKFELVDDRCCFVCGMENEGGLRIEWKVDGLVMTAEYVPERKYQGWKGILHGGIIATLLDETMTRLAGVVCGFSVTAEMNVRFVAPAKIGEVLKIRGEIVGQSRKVVEMKASIHDAAGKLVAHSSGKAIKMGS